METPSRVGNIFPRTPHNWVLTLPPVRYSLAVLHQTNTCPGTGSQGDHVSNAQHPEPPTLCMCHTTVPLGRNIPQLLYDFQRRAAQLHSRDHATCTPGLCRRHFAALPWCSSTVRVSSRTGCPTIVCYMARSMFFVAIPRCLLPPTISRRAVVNGSDL